MLAPIKLILNLLLWAIQFFLGLHFLFRLFGANPKAPFVAWVNEMSVPLLEPFRNIFPATPIAGHVFDFTTLAAFLFYVFIGYLLFALIALVERSGSTEKA